MVSSQQCFKFTGNFADFTITGKITGKLPEKLIFSGV